MNNIKFATLISYLTSLRKNDAFDIYDIQRIAELVTDMNEPNKVSETEVNFLLVTMGAGTNKIDAIRTYRSLTGLGLKEAKDAVEKYWVSKLVSEDKMLSNLKKGDC